MQWIPTRLLRTAVILTIPAMLGCRADTGEEPFVEPEPGLTTTTDATGLDAAPAELRTAIDEYTAAWNGNDPAAVAAHFTENAVARIGDETYNGRQQILAGWLQDNVAAVSNLQVTTTVFEPHGDAYHAEGPYTLTVTPGADAEQIAESGRYTVMWTRDADGQWRISETTVIPDTPQT